MQHMEIVDCLFMVLFSFLVIRVVEGVGRMERGIMSAICVAASCGMVTGAVLMGYEGECSLRDDLHPVAVCPSL
jgi:nitric oxide reductase large subunit